MKNRLIIILPIWLFSLFGFSQQADSLKALNNKEYRKVVQSMSIKPVLGFEYSFAYQYSKHLGLGFSIRYGFAIIKFGHEIQINTADVQFYSQIDKCSPVILFVPLVFIFNL